MTRKFAKNFFVQDGRPLNPKHVDYLESPLFVREAISTLSNIKPTKREILHGHYLGLKGHLNTVFSKRFLVASSSWTLASLVISAFFATVLFKVPLFINKNEAPDKYSLFASKPLTLDSMKQKLIYRDSRAVRIDSVFKHFNCPLTGLGHAFVEEADINGIPYWISAAIAFQESSCGKNTPVIDGTKTKNAWGWATYGDSVYDFSSYEQGIQVVSKYLNKRFYSRGITDLCEIMKVYTPPSKGSWCEGVEYFGNFIQDYKSPQS